MSKITWTEDVDMHNRPRFAFEAVVTSRATRERDDNSSGVSAHLDFNSGKFEATIYVSGRAVVDGMPVGAEPEAAKRAAEAILREAVIADIAGLQRVLAMLGDG